MRTGNRKAAQRAEALFQQEQFLAPSLALLLQDAPDDRPRARSPRHWPSAIPGRANFVKAAVHLLLLAYAEADRSRVGAQFAVGAALSVDEAQPLLDRLLAADDPGEARMLWAAAPLRRLDRERQLRGGEFAQRGEVPEPTGTSATRMWRPSRPTRWNNRQPGRGAAGSLGGVRQLQLSPSA